MIKILPSGTSAKFSFGIRNFGGRTVRGRLGEGAREQRYSTQQAVLEARWKDTGIEAVLTAETPVFLRSVSLHFHFHTPRHPRDVAIWTDTASVSEQGGFLSTAKKRSGTGVIWLSEAPEAEGILFRQVPPVEYPVQFECHPIGKTLEIIWSVDRMLEAGEKLQLPLVRIVRGDRERLLSSWRREWRSASRRDPSPDRRIVWRETGEADSPNTAKAMVAAIKASRLPIQWFALGPGYAAATGDWLTPEGDFRDRMGITGRSISEQSLVPGLRIAPFLASRKSSLVNEHRDWFVQSVKGKPVTVKPYERDRDESFVLDISNPAVRSHIKRILGVMRDQWGFRAFIFERLGDITVRGLRHNNGMGPGALYDTAAELIREALGNRVYIAASGIPLQVSAGMWDARVVSGETRRGRGRKADADRLTAAFQMLHRAPWTEGGWSNASCSLPLELFSGTRSIASCTLLNATAISTGLTLFSGNPADLDETSVKNISDHIQLFDEARNGSLSMVVNAGGGRKEPLVVRNDTGWIGLFNFSGRKKEIRLDRDSLRKALGVSSALSAGDGAVFNSPEIHVALPPRGNRLFRG